MAKIFRVTLTGTYFGVNFNNVWHYRSESNDSMQAGPLATEFVTQWGNAIRGIWNNQVSGTGLHVVDVPDTGDFWDVSLTWPGTFGANGTKLPPAYATCITINTANSPIRHGFKRFIGVDEDAISAGVPSTAFVTALDTLLAKFEDDLENSGYTFSPIIPRYTGTPAVITLWTPVIGAFFKRFGYQRTRES